MPGPAPVGVANCTSLAVLLRRAGRAQIGMHIRQQTGQWRPYAISILDAHGDWVVAPARRARAGHRDCSLAGIRDQAAIQDCAGGLSDGAGGVTTTRTPSAV